MKKNVLLVDDDSIFQMLGAKTLHRVGIPNASIQTAHNGKQAIDILRRPETPRPDFILLDLNMPIMNGFEFLEEFNTLSAEEKDETKVIIVSSSENPSDIARAKMLGASEYLTKPLKEEKLSAILAAA